MCAAPPAPPINRGINEPPTSNVVKGPREGFIEDISVNLQQLTRRFKGTELSLVDLKVGRHTGTRVVVAYLDTVADSTVVDKVVERIRSIDIDGIVDSYYIAQFLQDEKVKLFKQVGGEEKADVIAAKILEGRVAILCDGSPVVLTVPYIIFEDVQSSDDYYTNEMSISFRRVIRISGALFAILLPGLYIALQLYHYNIVPINMLVTITNSVENSPLSPMLETLFVLILFEIIFEASLRMPRHLGAVTGLISVLVLGEAAVSAGLISTPAVLVSALSGITMYILPNLAPQISLLRFFFAIIGGLLGLYGIIIASVLLVIYLCSLNSYGSPYLAPYAPYIGSDTKDGIFKANVRDMIMRPSSIRNCNKVRSITKAIPPSTPAPKAVKSSELFAKEAAEKAKEEADKKKKGAKK
jgi:spore germination protein KA